MKSIYYMCLGEYRSFWRILEEKLLYYIVMSFPGISEGMLETVVPKEPLSLVKIVRGKRKNNVS